MPLSPYPDIQIQALGGLTFPWADYTSRAGTTGDASFSPDGCSLALVMLIYWDNLKDACQQLLGYSYRVSTNQLSRIVPWNSPQWPNLWCTRIAKVQGVKSTGKVEDTLGPYSSYDYALLTLQITRPPYPILRDADTPTSGGFRQEWYRYMDRLWAPQVQMLTRPNGSFKFVEGTPSSGANASFTVGIGQKIGKIKLKRRWYQLPENAIYDSNGFPLNLVCDIADSNNVILGTVNSTTFFGMPAGTLLYETPEIIPRPLHLPAELMNLFPPSELLPQLQYDVVFNFEYFNPRIGTGATTRGHNCAPWTNDDRWYKVASQAGNPPFASYDFNNLFKIL